METATNQVVLVEKAFQTDDYAPSFEYFELEFTPELIVRLKYCMSILKKYPWMHHICIECPVDAVNKIDADVNDDVELSEELYFESAGLRIFDNCFYAFGQQNNNAQNQYESERMELGENDLIILKP